MTSLKAINRRVGSFFAIAALALATITPGLVPAFASAAQMSERSVELSSSSKSMTGTVYTVKFKAQAATAAAAVIDFCSNSPLIGAPCTHPAGFSTASVTTTTSNFTIAPTTASGDDAVVLTGAITNASETALNITGITNPSTTGPLYVRIVTYTDATSALAYQAETLGSDVADQGGAAVSITDTVGVSGAVLESMTFCVAGNAITGQTCTRADAAALTAPTVRLGEAVGNTNALDANHVSEGSIYAQLSTNAVGGAVVNLQSTATGCGGLVRAGGAQGNCDITPALAGGITAGQAKFGVRVAPDTDPTTGTVGGSFGAYNAGAYYSDSVFKLNYVAADASGITSPFGDPFLDTAGAPVNNKNVKITFGASAANNTPAGLYSTDLSLIATGKF